jgi:hypothetical protein
MSQVAEILGDLNYIGMNGLAVKQIGKISFPVGFQIST